MQLIQAYYHEIDKNIASHWTIGAPTFFFFFFFLKKN